MVFRDSKFVISRIGTVAILAVTMVTATACSSRGEKNVAIECAPGQSKGADGKCQSASTQSTGATQTPTDFQPMPPQEQQGEEQQGQQQEDSTLLPEGEQDKPTEQEQDKPSTSPQQPPAQQPPAQQPPAQQPPAQQPPAQQPPAQQPPGQQPPGQQPTTTTDPINTSETVTTLFTDAPAATADGAPLIALKLVTSPTEGKVARAAFSYVTGVTSASFTYHKKTLTAKSSPFNDGTLNVDIESLPVSLAFEWDGKTCSTGVVDVGFEAKTAKATCK